MEISQISLVYMALAMNLDSCGGLLLWKRSETEVWLDNSHLWEELLSLLALDSWVDNDIVTCNVLADHSALFQ